MTAPAWTAVADGLFDPNGDGIRLIVGRLPGSEQWVFPAPRSENPSCEIVRLPTEGTLWAWTVQRFRPKAPFNGDDDPRGFKPYAVGYVAFGNIIIVEGRLIVNDFADLRLGLPMRSVVDIYRTDDNGAPIATYAFQPQGEA